MAIAIADQELDLHVWARRASSLDALGGTSHTPHASIASLAGAVDIVALCVSTDEDVLRIVEEEVLPHLRQGGIVINHGTGIPVNAIRIAELSARRGVDSLDAPVTGGRPAAETKMLTVLVGGPTTALQTASPVLHSYATNVVHLGGPGSGQMAKLFNNALLMLNQASIAEILKLAAEAGLDATDLVAALRLGSADSRALQLMNTMVNPSTVDHLSKVEALDMALFDQAMHDAGIASGPMTKRGLEGASRLHEVIDRLNP